LLTQRLVTNRSLKFQIGRARRVSTICSKLWQLDPSGPAYPTRSARVTSFFTWTHGSRRRNQDHRGGRNEHGHSKTRAKGSNPPALDPNPRATDTIGCPNGWGSAARRCGVAGAPPLLFFALIFRNFSQFLVFRTKWDPRAANASDREPREPLRWTRRMWVSAPLYFFS
jgi:hypothetical protein